MVLLVFICRAIQVHICRRHRRRRRIRWEIVCRDRAISRSSCPAYWWIILSRSQWRLERQRRRRRWDNITRRSWVGLNWRYHLYEIASTLGLEYWHSKRMNFERLNRSKPWTWRGERVVLGDEVTMPRSSDAKTGVSRERHDDDRVAFLETSNLTPSPNLHKSPRNCTAHWRPKQRLRTLRLFLL